jgi:hypothetical protein
MHHQRLAALSGLTTERLPLAAVYATVLAALAYPAIKVLNNSPMSWASEIRLQAILLIVVPSLVLLTSVLSNRHSLAWSIYWTWSLIFLGLASAYQMSGSTFPWKGSLSEEHISTAQHIVLLAHTTVFVSFLAGRPAIKKAPDATPAVVPGLKQSPQLKKAVMFILSAHVLTATVFCTLMGSALFTGRLAFQQRLGDMEDIPAFGSMYFLSNAGAIVLPAMAIVLRKAGLDIPKFAIFVSVALSFLVTNPFIGSRFLTGSFLVAVIAASVSSYARRWIPVGVVLAFVTVFPTLDLLRGDGTGATKIEITPPEETLTTFDYDSFEMLTREVSLQGQIPRGLPTQLELLVAPFLRWIPGLSQTVQGDASGPVVAMSTGMNFTNVSMPLWAEAHLIGAWGGVVLAFLLFGRMLAYTRGGTPTADGRTIFGTLIEVPMASLLFIILRGSLYEVLGYLLLAATIGLIFSNAERRDRLVRGELHAVSDPANPWVPRLRGSPPRS